MEIRSLIGITSGEILETFNRAFSDYFVPLQLSLDQLESKMKADKTNLDLSVGAFAQGKLVAFMLHGFDTIDGRNLVYNGGTGVIPEQRGNGLSRKMYQFVLPLLEGRGIDSVQLEVISNNVQAIKSYKRSGFKTNRVLACYKGDLQVESHDPKIWIEQLETYDWPILASFWDIRPSWQNSKNTLEVLQPINCSLGAYLDDELVGYAVYNPQSNRLQQIGVHKKHRRQGVGTALLSHLGAAYGTALTVINIDDSGTHVQRFFEAMGLKPYLEQLEMELKLDGNPVKQTS